MRTLPASLALVFGTVTTVTVPMSWYSLPGRGSGDLPLAVGWISSLIGTAFSLWALGIEAGAKPGGHRVSSRPGIFVSLALSFWPWLLLVRIAWG